MKKEEKKVLVNQLVERLAANNIVYFTATAHLTAIKDNQFRRMCFGKGIEVLVVKNSLLKKAMQQVADKDYSDIYSSLTGQTALLFAQVANSPAKAISEFAKKEGVAPVFKAAYVEHSTFVGADKLQALVDLKSKEELIADIVALLQSPIKNVVSALQSSSNTITGVLQTLSERAE